MRKVLKIVFSHGDAPHDFTVGINSRYLYYFLKFFLWLSCPCDPDPWNWIDIQD